MKIKNDRINQPGRFFVIIGRHTFSAAQNAANRLERETFALFVGGPSRERGISLNSGRSIVDHLAGADIAIEPIVYIDTRSRAFEIDRNLLYCNTPDDFDFKLSGSPVLDAGKLLWRKPVGTKVVTAPLVAGERIFVLGVDRRVIAWDALDGRKLWQQQRPGEPLRLAHRPLPRPGPGQLLLKVEA